MGIDDLYMGLCGGYKSKRDEIIQLHPTVVLLCKMNRDRGKLRYDKYKVESGSY